MAGNYTLSYRFVPLGQAARVANDLAAVVTAGGGVTRQVDTAKSRFVRTQVLNSSGIVIGRSNPVWLLRSTPPHGIPAPRAC